LESGLGNKPKKGKGRKKKGGEDKSDPPGQAAKA
jgi:hypothetical protein